MSHKVERLFVIFNNHFRGQGVVNALQLMQEFSGRLSEAPESLKEAYPQEMSV
jgi:hypothetical protein